MMESFTTSDGCEIAYSLYGERDKPLLVLAHSLGCDHTMWAQQHEAFCAHYCVLVFDIRGHGRSSAPVGDYQISIMGRDILELIDAIGNGRFSFCGVSMGGMIGQWIAANAPSRIDKLILANTAAAMGTDDYWNDRIERIQRSGMAALAPEIINRWFTPQFKEAASDIVRGFEEALCHMSPLGYTGACAAIRDFDISTALTKITAQTLIICGAHDMATPPHMSATIASHIPLAELTTLDAAHLSNIEAPIAFRKKVLSFLER